MKRYFILVGLFVALMCSCNNQASRKAMEKQRQDSIEAAEREAAEKEALEKRRQDSIQVAEREAAEREAAEKERIERESFTTSLPGIYMIDDVLARAYEVGLRDGGIHKSSPDLYYKYNDTENEREYKKLWTRWYGIPNNDKAKNVYNRALQKYLKGYEDAWNF